MFIVSKKGLRANDPEVFGVPPKQRISHANRVYGLTIILALIALTHWIIIGSLFDITAIPKAQVSYGWWIVGTYFGVVVLAWTNVGRKVPWNYFIIAIIVETSTIYIAMEQNESTSFLVNIYAGVIVVAIMMSSVFWGAYFPMYVVPGDLVLSLLVAIGNIMMIIFFINAYFINYAGIYVAVRNTFALISICMMMYTATIVHDRQFDVPKHEYLFLSVLQFFAYVVLHERVLNMASDNTEHSPC